MAKRSVIWTGTAATQRKEVLKYWIEKNKSTKYAEKLIFIIRSRVNTIANYPESFKKSKYPNTRVSSLGHYSIYYKFEDDKIFITAFWDNRQNPKKLLKILGT